MNRTIEERNVLVEENSWVADAVVKRFAHLNKVDRDDMRNSALTSMIRGAELYDDSKGAKPSTYLYWWAEQGVKSYLYKNRQVHVPANQINKQVRINRVEGTASTRIVPNETSLDFFNDERNGKRANSKDCFEKEVLKSITADMTNVYAASDLKDHIEYVVNRDNLLSDIERFTIIHRMGLMGEERKTQASIASLTSEVFGKTYSTMGINKAEKRALLKLKDDEQFLDVLA